MIIPELSKCRTGELMFLYWDWQRKAHTEPELRKYLPAIIKLLKRRGVKTTTLNNVGLSLEAHKKI